MMTQVISGVAAATPQEAPAAVSGSGIAAGGTSLIIVLLLGFYLYRAVDKKKTKPIYLVAAFTVGALLSGSLVGVMAKQTANSLGTGAVTMFGTVTNGASTNGGGGGGR
jgi:hypothetical protein